VQAWPGNTFICHVRPDGTAHKAIRGLQEEMKMSRFARFFTFLPPSSFHMTVFQGISPIPATAALQPEGPRPGEPRHELSAELLARVEDIVFDPSPAARMVDLFCGYSLTVTGAGPEGEAPLRRMRETLRNATGIAPPDFDDYVFHITLAYLLEWLTEETAEELVAFSAALTDGYAEALSAIPLGPVEFCTFETMHHFEPVKRLV